MKGFIRILTVATATLSAGVLAQDTDTQLLASRSAPVPTDSEGIRYVQELGLCAAPQGGRYSRAVLRAYPGSEESHEALFWIAMGSNSCVERDEVLRFAPRSLRGPVAEYLLKRDFDLSTWTRKRRPLAIYDTPTHGEIETLAEDIRAHLIFVEVGSCVAKTDPSGSAALFATSVTSQEESAAFAQLSGSLAACLPSGVTLRMSPFQLRGYIAEGAYRNAATRESAE